MNTALSALRRPVAVIANLLLTISATVLAGVPSYAAVPDRLGTPTITSLGTFGGIPYVRYDGVFEGETSTGAFRVPYRISAPADPSLSNGAVLVEPPHFAIGLGTLNFYLRPDFLLGRGFVHAGIGWGTFGNRILDPGAPGTFIDGGFDEFGSKVDDEIVTDFARALHANAEAAVMAGTVKRRYLVGFSDSTTPILRLVESGEATGAFDFAMPFTTESFDPQAAMAAGSFPGKVIIVNSEADDPSGLLDRGLVPNQYRFYVVAGTPHIPDPLDIPFPSNESTPASFAPALRAHFLQGHHWVLRGAVPPVSTQLRTTVGGVVDRDANSNAVTEDRTGNIVPRLPFVELGEARYVSGFIGSYDSVKSVRELGFATHEAYLKAFNARLSQYAKAGYILRQDAAVMRRRAELCPPLTFTETYRDHHASFVAIQPCSP